MIVVQPIASEDVAAALADVTLGAPISGTLEVAGPERRPLAELVRKYLSANKDHRDVVVDAEVARIVALVLQRRSTEADAAVEHPMSTVLSAPSTAMD
ncbi:hypothetical protein WME89_13060 [Sorangium sp. So ce321]|uniref:hypothetical protein n=1 Tax=Sorangium sp. So ce321 TaxID=3133300 RepID=UPI003F5E0AC4